ncbi:VOC family protein [Arsenicicoccus sp. oral taxon 190]|uniref:VOC family protein n=1 Tax=Arsenicicoccus sp. oral taxon 190 TaxID=1658671 RepID=UPI00067A2E1D|nr:VOC family protein [Arsenicicoccus sp. oral taxon 190]AKT52894.1 glyoxalase [Arsenicicoccus sp. oral taxon 190]
MTFPVPYVLFPGTARDALTTYQQIFGGELVLHTRADMDRTDEPLDAIGHGMLRGPVTVFGADASDGEGAVSTTGLLQALLGAGDPDTSHRWFAALAEGGTVVDDLQERPWGAWDGQVVDRFGLHWLIGFEPQA